MRYAAFSNVNGNIENMTMILDILKREKINQYICLGNIACYGENPNDCVDLLKRMNLTAIAGKLDHACSREEELGDYKDFDKAAILKARHILTPQNKEFLSNLPLTYSDSHILATHYSPESPEIKEYITNQLEAALIVSTFKEQICFIASFNSPAIYSILPLTKQIQGYPEKAVTVKNFKQYLVNTGSIYYPGNLVDTSTVAVYNQEAKVIVLHQFPIDLPDRGEDSDDGPNDGNDLAGSPAYLPPKPPLQDQDKHDWPKE